MNWQWEAEFSQQMREIIEFSARVYDRGLVSAAGGNVSARCGGKVLITGSNVPLRNVTADGLVLCDLNAERLEGNPHIKPSKETTFHLGVYKARPDVKYIIHAHPSFSIAWSLLEEKLPLYTESARLKLLDVPIVPTAAPGSAELAQNVAKAVAQADAGVTAFIMQAHGILVMGETMESCFNQAELLEDTAKIAVFQRLMTKG